MTSRDRQAVVVVHGIGEQRPTATVDAYVEAVMEDHDLAFGAPDRVSGYSDMRCTKVTWLPRLDASDGTSSTAPIHTDFYELYWAHLVHGTQLRHVVAWLTSLIPRLREIGPRMRRFLLKNVRVGAAMLAVGLALVVVGVGVDLDPRLGAILRWLGSIVSAVAVGWLIRHLGDVPRYLHNVAGNVAIQRAVRREGVELLKRLHGETYRGSGRPRYERIVVVGHSLGSVVAYDIVRDYWAEAYKHFAVSPTGSSRSTIAADAVDGSGEQLWRMRATEDSGPLRDDFRAKQRELAAALPEAASLPPGEDEPRRWMITDLVTLACPLTHADFLLAPSRQRLETEQWRRSLATSPPRRQMARPTYRFAYTRGPRSGLESLHHAAPFASVRWTNLYFENDVVGGPLAPLFGPGIVDIALEDPQGASRFPRVHSQYVHDASSRATLQSIIWDGAVRQPPDSVQPLLHLTLQRMIRELAALVDHASWSRSHVAGMPSARGLSAAEVDALKGAAEHVAGGGDIDQTVEGLRDLLFRIPAYDPALPDELEDDPESLAAEPRQVEDARVVSADEVGHLPGAPALSEGDEYWEEQEE